MYSAFFGNLFSSVLIKPRLLYWQRVRFMTSFWRTKTPGAPTGTFDEDDTDTGVTIPGDWRIEGMPANNLMDAQRLGSNHYGEEAKQIREEFKDFFVTPQGEVPWQYRYI